MEILLNAIRKHAETAADHDKNGWDYIAAMSDDELIDLLDDDACTTIAEAIATCEKEAARYIDYLR